MTERPTDAEVEAASAWLGERPPLTDEAPTPTAAIRKAFEEVTR